MHPISSARHQIPPEVIRHATWLYLRFTLRRRDSEELLAERGLDISYETIRRWVVQFGTAFARNLRQLRPRPSDRWHLNEMVVSIQGRHKYLWRAVDSEGEILDVLVQPKRDKAAAPDAHAQAPQEAGLRSPRARHRSARSYGAARRELGLLARHEQGLRKNNRAGNSHQVVRRREFKMLSFKSPASAQRFLSIHSTIYNTFNLQRHLISRCTLRLFRAEAVQQWQRATAAA